MVRRFLIGAMLVGFASLVAAGAAAVWLTGRNQQHTRWVNHTYEVELAIEHARILVEQGETTRRGYLLTRQPVYLDTYRATAARLPGALDTIARLTIDNPRQRANTIALREGVAALLGQREQSFDLIGAGMGDRAVARFAAETGAGRMRGLRDRMTAMSQEEQRLLVLRNAEQRASVRGFFWVLAAAGLLLALVALAALFTVMRFIRDLGRSRAAVDALNETLEDQVRYRTADLSRANEEIQRFAYIVSHDLRSPLVNVMGFTAELAAAAGVLGKFIDRVEAASPELADDEARVAAKEDLPEAIGFIRTSTAKMDRLINAILKLSREGRRVLAPERLDMAALVANSRDTLIQQIEARGAEVVVEPPLPDIVSDRVAVDQIVSNLIENATKYLEPGRPGRIVVRGRREGARAIFEVADNGRGIDPRDHDRIFDLFRRAGRQDMPGEGIGLAHVRALAYRLGGTVDVASTLGDGATFRLSLPIAFNDQEDQKR